MVILKCTKRLLSRLDESETQRPPPSTNRLGDWYAKPLETNAGELVIFANEKTLLSVAIPMSEVAQLKSIFRLRVYNLLRLLGIPMAQAELEIAAYNEVGLAKTTSRRVLGSLNEIGYQYEWIAARGDEGGILHLSSAELELSRFLHGPLSYRYPVEVAAELLSRWA